MPYIPQYLRDGLRRSDTRAMTSGQLHYQIMCSIKTFLGSIPDYEQYNAALGVLNAAGHELYRRQIGPYEDEAIKRNGDL